jgi:hypothetical protein
MFQIIHPAPSQQHHVLQLIPPASSQQHHMLQLTPPAPSQQHHVLQLTSQQPQVQQSTFFHHLNNHKNYNQRLIQHIDNRIYKF